MLVEYALVPDVLDSTCYSSPELCEASLQILKPILLEEAPVRDLRGGEWWNYLLDWIKTLPEQCHPKAKELLKKLKQKEHIRTVPFCGPQQPSCPAAWLEEALASHQWQNLVGVITLSEVARQHRDNPLIISIDKLTSADWRRRHESSIEIPKQSSTYLQHLRLLLNHANSILFIDPYLDPTQSHYQEFHFLLKAIKRVGIPPLVEIHVAAKGKDKQGGDRSQFPLTEWKSRFCPLKSALEESGLRAEVFVWEYFHDRFILTNLAGLTLSGGLDVIQDPTARVIWSRLPNSLRDEKQSDFSRNSAKHTLKYHFELS